jgi:hypothetical protein
MPETPSKFLPTVTDELLLAAALAEPERAADAWRRWTSTVDFNALDVASCRLLPLAAYNLHRAGLERKEFQVAVAERRRALVATDLRMREAKPVMQALSAAGIEMIVLKGASLGVLDYPSPDLRPMSDIDILVRPTAVEPALRALTEQGFRPAAPVTETRRRLIHGENFSRADGAQIDLHWHLYPSRTEIPSDDEWWSHARPFELEGVPLLALSAADQLVHALGHGLTWSPTPGHRWVADVAMILRAQGAKLDIDRVVESARTMRKTSAVLCGLQLIQRLGLTPVPQTLIERLAEVPVSLSDRVEFDLGLRRRVHTVAGEIPLYAIRYAHRARAAGRTPTPWGLVGFVRDLWAAPDASAVLRRVIERSTERVTAWWRQRAN